MKKLVTLFAAVLVAAGAALSVAAESEAIADGGFEDAVGDVYANGGKSVLEQTKDVYYHGGASLKVTLRENEWGGPAWDVTEYVRNHGDGEYYCSFAILGTFSGAIRATLHTTYEDGGDYYRQVGSLKDFAEYEWMTVGYGEDGKPLPLRTENWNEEDITKWDPVIRSEGHVNATLYFWIEGNNNADLYMDNMNFWGSGDEPVDYTASGANTTPKVPSVSDGSNTSFGFIDDDTETTVSSSEDAKTTTDSPSSGTEKPREEKSNTAVIVIICVAAAVAVAVVVVVAVKIKKQ